MSAAYLFSVDLEDVSPPGGDCSRSRVEELTAHYLDFLRRHDSKGTFFVVGEVARALPELVRRIAGEGHEIGCHSDRHVPLDRLDPSAFGADLSRNLKALASAGVQAVRGYRAPCFSLTEATRWAYPILKAHGFTYSSSVLPARNPLHGWPGFGQAPRLVEGTAELPLTLRPWRALPVPMGGGAYFRTLPMPLLAAALRIRRRRGEEVLGYLHPYDIDTQQEGIAHPGFSRWSPYNWLMRANRGAVLARLEAVVRTGFALRSYGSHAEAQRRRVQEREQAGDGG